jgi:FkbM family methyltransferase
VTMYAKTILKMASLAVHFRNGRELVRCMRAGIPCDELILWDGTRIEHPKGRGGLIEIAIELWLENVYTDGFYRPRAGDTIVDAGANVGVFSIRMARQNRKCRVLALEPFAENFQYLQANVGRAHAGNVTCREMALGAAFGTGEMQSVGSRSLDHVFRADAAGHGGGTSMVPLSGLFDLTQSTEIDFLKVDIEGSERDVFAAAGKGVLRRFSHIAIEYHDAITAGTLETLQRVLSPTHELTLRPVVMPGCGILLVRRRDRL